MKKWIALTLCGMVTLAMAACGNNSSAMEQKESSSAKTQQLSTPESSSSADELTDSGNVQIPNPFVECAMLEEAAGLAGFTLTIPDTVEGYAYRRIFVMENEMLCRGGLPMDRAEFLLDRYGNNILRLAYSYLHNLNDAEEILRTLFCNI